MTLLKKCMSVEGQEEELTSTEKIVEAMGKN